MCVFSISMCVLGREKRRTSFVDHASPWRWKGRGPGAESQSDRPRGNALCVFTGRDSDELWPKADSDRRILL